MDHQEYMSVWKKNCIRIGSPTNILAALTAFIGHWRRRSRQDPVESAAQSGNCV